MDRQKRGEEGRVIVLSFFVYCVVVCHTTTFFQFSSCTNFHNKIFVFYKGCTICKFFVYYSRAGGCCCPDADQPWQDMGRPAATSPLYVHERATTPAPGELQHFQQLHVGRLENFTTAQQLQSTCTSCSQFVYILFTEKT